VDIKADLPGKNLGGHPGRNMKRGGENYEKKDEEAGLRRPYEGKKGFKTLGHKRTACGEPLTL